MHKTGIESEEVIDFEAKYNSQYNQIEIIANESTLRYLCDILQDLTENGKSGSHYQFDETDGLQGNVSMLVIAKR